MGLLYLCFKLSISGGETCGKLPLGRPRRKWEDNIKVELKERGRRVCTGLTYLRESISGALL
jgi:hypothetical protein